MANGRLGKASIAAKDTVAVYTNNSGAEASVSVVAVSPSGTDMYLRIDDTSSAVKTTTVLTTESYSDTYFKYVVGNTAVTSTSTPSYVGRAMADVPASLHPRFYDGTTASGGTGIGNYYFWAPWTMEAAAVDGQYQVYNGSYAYNLAYTGNEDPSTFYKASWGYNGTAINTLVASGTVLSFAFPGALSYEDRGMAVDPYLGYSVGVNSNAYMSVTGYDADANTTRSTSKTSDSLWYGSIKAGSVSTYNYHTLRIQNGFLVLDGGGSASRIIIPSTRAPEVSGSATNLANSWIDASAPRFHISTPLTLSRGSVSWYEYNPNDEYWYIGIRSSGTTYNCRFNTNMENWTSNSAQALSYSSNNSTYGWEALGTSGISEQTAGQFASASWAFRSFRIGASKWALYGTDGTNTDVWISEDLQSWVAAPTYYGASYQYSEQLDATFVSMATASTDLTAVKSAIGTLGDDGILEQGLTLSQYERTGLVLSNGDRILAYNDGSNPLVVNVMGYEGN